MEYLFFDKENVFLEDYNGYCEKISKKEILQYLDLPVITLNLYVKSFFDVLKSIGLKDINTIFKHSLNGFKVEDLIKDLNKKLDSDILLFNNRIEVSWFTSTEYDYESDKDEIIEFIRVRCYNRDEYFSIGDNPMNELKELIININNRYIIDDSYGDMSFSGIKRITLRLLIESILYETTINKDNLNKKPKLVSIRTEKEQNKVKQNNINAAKLKLIDLQEELDDNEEEEEYEKCAEIKKEIEKYDKIIKDGR